MLFVFEMRGEIRERQYAKRRACSHLDVYSSTQRGDALVNIMLHYSAQTVCRYDDRGPTHGQ